MKSKLDEKLKNYYIFLREDDIALLPKWRIRIIEELNKQISYHGHGNIKIS